MLHSSHARPPGLPPAPPGAHASLQHRVASWPTCRGCPSRPAPSSAAAGITRVTARAVFCHCLLVLPCCTACCCPLLRCLRARLHHAHSADRTVCCPHTLPHAYSAALRPPPAPPLPPALLARLRLRSPACCRPPRPPALAAGVSDTQRRCVYDDCPRVQCPGPQPRGAGLRGLVRWRDRPVTLISYLFHYSHTRAAAPAGRRPHTGFTARPTAPAAPHRARRTRKIYH